jgi:type I restriction enzyme R subunit
VCSLTANPGQNEELALRIDETIKKTRPDAWRGVQARENVIKAALYGVLQDSAEVERVFLIISAQKEY